MDDFSICPKLEAAFELLSKKWTGLILHVLFQGRARFKDLSQLIPQMSDRMLTERLKELELIGIIERIVHPTTPVRIEYQLTPMGQALEPMVNETARWANTWIRPH